MPHFRKTLAALSTLLLAIAGCGVAPIPLPPPVISPAGGTFSTVQTVTITDTNPTGVIHYTVDGTAPGPSSPKYTGPFQVATTLTVRAVDVISSTIYSEVAGAVFVINLPPATAPVISPATGSYVGPQTVTITDTTPGATIYYTTNGSTPTTASTKYTTGFTLSASSNVRAVAIAPGYSVSSAALSSITILPTVAVTPVITPPGGTFNTSQVVAITDITAGSVIYYTIDGSTPTAASTRYTGTFRISTTAVVKAIAIAPGYRDSAIAQASFTINTAGAGGANGVSLGKKPVVGAQLQMYAAGATGYGSVATVISSGTVVTDASGDFYLTYSCVRLTDQVYLVSRGGTPSGRTTSVPGLVLVTALGQCGTLGTTATVNELTTVAAAYALAQFAGVSATDGASHVGASSTNASGIAKAFLTASALANPTTGVVSGPTLASTSTLPVSEMNTLADMISSCGAATGSDPCAPLLSAATFPGSFAPTDSFMAMVNVALHPANNASTLYGLTTAGVFTPRLSAAPNDWTLALTHTGGGINKPTAIGIDATSNVWVADFPGALSQLSAQGAAVSPSTGYTGGGMYELYGLTIDPTGNIWVTSAESAASVNSGKGAVQRFSSTGVLQSGSTGFGGNGVNFPEYAAADALGNIWIANYGNSTAALLSPTGSPITPSGGLAGSQFALPNAVATDASNGAWFANQGGTSVVRVGADRTVGAAVTCCNAPSGVALDSAGNVWVTNFYGDSVSEVRPSGTVALPGSSVGTGSRPQGIAVDGANNVWVANNLSNTLAELQGEGGTGTPGTLLSGSSGYGAAAAMQKPARLAIDGSGNLWVTSYGTSASSGAVMEFIGLAAPLKTPLIGLPAKP